MVNETMMQSDPFVGRWHGLVSTTNWEKGRIILEWRQAFDNAEDAAGDHSDEAWSQKVGGVTPQHVGRLRRVYERFHGQYESFDGLFWSHFHAALDWQDAEMWLEGAVQSGWSVSQMRRQRWETLGSIPEQEPLEDQVVASELDEDVDVGESEVPDDSEPITRSLETVENLDKRTNSPEAGEFKAHPEDGKTEEDVEPTKAAVAVRPFANLPELPEDVTEAFEAYKLAIIRHRTSDWEEISRDDLVISLESLKQLAMAPSE